MPVLAIGMDQLSIGCFDEQVIETAFVGEGFPEGTVFQLFENLGRDAPASLIP